MEGLHSFTNLVNNKLETPLRNHLKSVYASIATSTLSAAGGAYLNASGILDLGFLSALASLGFLFAIMFSRRSDGKNVTERFMYLTGFAFCTGLSSGNLISAVWSIDPSLVISALMYTGVIFTCFSLSALIAPDGKYLALGGPLMSACSAMMLTSIINIFIGSYSIAYIQILFGVLLMSGFILYDTQSIMEKFRMGDQDFVWHSLQLFIDLVSVFKHILVLLTEKDQRSRDKRRSR